MTNLLAETITALARAGKAPSDVRWVGSSGGKYAITWEAFAAIAPSDYDSGFGGQEIADDLVVVGSEWWLERHQYDGSEWWEYKRIPVRQESPTTFTTVLNGDSWASLEEMNRIGGKYDTVAP